MSGLRGRGRGPVGRKVVWKESEWRWCFLAGLLLGCPRGREQPMSGQYPLPAMLAIWGPAAGSDPAGA